MSVGQTYARAIIPDAINRQREDFYPTPPVATRALLSVESFEGTIWEPACGDGAISELLVTAGHDVISTDLIYRGYGLGGVDFLLAYRTRTDNIITNPPFKHGEAFIWHALSRTTRKVVMLARLAFLEGQARRRLFAETPIARVWVFSKRIPIRRNGEGSGNGLIAFAWYVWEHGHQGKPTLGWL